MTASARQRAEVAARRAEVLRLRVAALPFATIAERTGHKTPGAAAQDLTRAAEEAMGWLKDHLPSWAVIELERLETVERTLQAALGAGVTQQDWDLVLRSAGSLTRLSQRRCELLGINLAALPHAKPESEADDVDQIAQQRAKRRGRRLAGQPQRT